MTPDAPEFRTKPTTPVSPVPFHPPEPSNIPVLRNQIDPIFNMTSHHVESADSSVHTVSQPINQRVDIVEPGDNDLEGSFSDPYDEEDDKLADNGNERAVENTDFDDDYAKTFDSEGEETSSKQDVSSENVDQKMQSLPAPVSDIVAENLPFTISASDSIAVSADGRDNSTSHKIFSPTAATTRDVPVAGDSAAAAAAVNTVQSHPQPSAYEAVSNGEIDIQQLLDNITANAALNAPSNSNNATPTSANSSTPSFPPGMLGLPAHVSLPPRPQITHQSPMHPAYPAQGDIRKYHSGPSIYPTPPANSYRPAGPTASIVAAGAPGTSTDPRNVLPPPPSASFHPTPPTGPPSMSYPAYQENQRPPTKDPPANAVDAPGVSDEGEISWGPTVQRLYDEFLQDERMYVSEGLWDRFPTGSRLFIGNLPSEQVTKRDLFYAFYKYGRLAQISIKQAYGFVQFHDVPACQSALKREQGQEIRGRKMHLEISKPQKNTRAAGAAAHPPPTSNRRSRSPDYMRGGVDRGIRGVQPGARGDGYDRYDARPGISPRDSEFRGPLRGRDDYRPGRSPSPPRGNYRVRDDYGAARGYDYYDGRERRRSRSRSPYGRRDNTRYRERSLSPRPRSIDEDADLQIPRRESRDVPDIQIVLMDELDRGFVGWIEGQLRARSLRVEVMLLSPRISLAAVIKRQIVEGVVAVAQLTRRSQDTSKIPLQVFDRTGGANNVRFDEYQDLEPNIAAELVVRAKQKEAAAVGPAYAQPPSVQAAYQQPPATGAAPNLANLVGSLDNATLQKLLGTLNTVAPPPQQQAPAATPPIDLAGILGGLVQQQAPAQQHGAYQTQAQSANLYTSPVTNASLASMLGNLPAQSQPQAQSAQHVQNIMAQLAKFRQ